MFSLCIATMDRFEFLKDSLPLYNEMDLIDEIIVCDENGKDANNLRSIGIGTGNDKVSLYVNDRRLGPLLNKLACSRRASKEWVAVIDSDNFADVDYFRVAADYVHSGAADDLSVLCPSKARPNFDLTSLCGVISKSNMREINAMDSSSAGKNLFGLQMNTGNYIQSRRLIQDVVVDANDPVVSGIGPYDALLLNVFMFEQLDMRMHVVPGMYYNHLVHSGSTWINTHAKSKNEELEMMRRFDLLRK